MRLHLQTLCLLALSLAPSAPLYATSVVCIRSPDSIVMAADSMLAVRGADNPGKPRRECKIIQADGVFFSMTGFVKDPARTYDAVRIAAAALEQGPSPTNASARVVDAIVAGLKEELPRLKAEAPELYDRFIKGQRGTLLKVLLADFGEGTPKAVLLGFKQASSPSGEIAITVERESCPGNCDPQGVNAFFLGDRRPIDYYIKSGKADWRSPEKSAKLLVDLVIDTHTPDVGPPVDVLRIDKDGAKWIEKKEECPEISRTISQPCVEDR